MRDIGVFTQALQHIEIPDITGVQLLGDGHPQFRRLNIMFLSLRLIGITIFWEVSMTARYDASSDWQRAKESLNHVFWIGGATTAGKSTIATKLACDFAMIHYNCDAHQSEYVARATEEEFPMLYAGTKGDIESFRAVLLQPPERIAEWSKGLWRERVIMAIEDLLALPAKKPVVADMFFGETIGELWELFDYDKAVFLVPTEEFHRAEYQRRLRKDWKQAEAFKQALEGCPDPETVFMEGWAQHQINYGQYVRDQCREHNLRVMITSGQSSLEESYRAVCDHFNMSRIPE